MTSPSDSHARQSRPLVERLACLAEAPPAFARIADVPGLLDELARRAAALLGARSAAAAYAEWGASGAVATREGGSLVVELTDAAGERRGEVRVADPERGEFSAEDAVLLVQLARTASLALAGLEWREGASRYRALVESNMVGVGFWAPGGRVVAANDALLGMIGYSRAEYEAGAVPWPELTPAEYYASDEKAFAQAMTLGRCTPYAKEYVRRDGTRIPVLVGGCRLDASREAGAFFVVDLTDRRRAEAELERAGERFRIAAESASDLIYEWEPATGRMEWFGDVDGRLGCPPNGFERTRASWEAALHPDDRARVLGAVSRHLETGAPFLEEYRVRRLDGTVAIWTDAGRAVRDDDGRPVRWYGLASDVTARHAAEAERARLLAEAEAARVAAEEAARRERLLAESGRVLSSSLDYEATLVAVADLAVPQLADWCAVDIVDEHGELRRLVVSHADPERVERAWAFHREHPGAADAAHGPYAVLRTGQPALLSDITDDMLVARAQGDTEHLEILRALGLCSAMFVPLTARDRTFGVLTFASAESGRRFGIADFELAQQLGRRAAMAVDNARLYREASRTLEELRRSEDRLRLAIDSAQLGTWDLDPVSGALRWSDRCRELFGVPPGADVTLDLFYQRLHPDDRARTRAVVEGMLGSGGAGDGEYDMEYRTLAPDGRLRWVAARGRAYFDATAQAVRFTGTVLDISEHKRAESTLALLAEAGRLLGGSLDYETTLQNAAQLAVGGLADYCVLDLFGEDGEVRRAAMAHGDGVPAEVFDSIRDLAPPESATTSPIRIVQAEGRPVVVPEVTGEWVAANAADSVRAAFIRDVRLRSLMVVPVALPGRVLGTLALGRVGDRVERFTAADVLVAEELGRRTAVAVENARLYAAMRESEDRFRRVAESLPQMIWTARADGAAEYFNSRWYEYSGASTERLGGSAWIDLVHPDDQPRARDGWAHAVQSGGPYEIEYRLRRADGSYRWHLSRATPVPDASGGIAQWFGSATDIHDQKQAEAAVRQAQKLESIGVLAGGIAHDFNNLLTGIMGNASLALRGAADGARPLLEDVIRASERAAELTSQLLAYAGKGRFFIQDVDLSALVRDLGGLVRTSVPKKVALCLELAHGVPAVEADASQLQQLVMNLVINAAESIGEGTGEVTVVVDEIELGPSECAGYPHFELAPGRFVRLVVRDTGCGMDEATLGQIFDPFFTTKFTGRGLGLAAAQGIVRGHKGAIAVTSAPGRGSVFTVLLPAAVRSAGRGAAPAASRRDVGGHGVVLVVDDEDVVRRTARMALMEYGYTVLEAGDGAQAVETLRAAPDGVDVVLLDMTMPVMGGEEAIVHLRRLRPELPVIASSGFGELEALRRFGGTGVSGFLQKPYTARQLAERVEAVLRERA